MRKYRFFYHYNKPLSRKEGKTIWTIHCRNQCYQVEHIDCSVPTQTKTNKRQPYGVVQGFASSVLFVNHNKVVIS